MRALRALPLPRWASMCLPRDVGKHVVLPLTKKLFPGAMRVDGLERYLGVAGIYHRPDFYATTEYFVSSHIRCSGPVTTLTARHVWYGVGAALYKYKYLPARSSGGEAERVGPLVGRSVTFFGVPCRVRVSSVRGAVSAPYTLK